jgi:hypothetical protein
MSLAVWAICFCVAKIANAIIGGLVIAKRVAPCARPGGAGVQGGEFFGHRIGYGLAIVKFAQHTENKAKKPVFWSLAIAKGGVATPRGIVGLQS